MAYFHGGVPGLKPGDRILPPDNTGTTRRLSTYADEVNGPAHARRTDIVYLTTDRHVASAYAALHPDGALYRVDPEGEVEPDPDCFEPGLSWQCPAATVVAVVDPVVLFRTKTLARWLRLLEGPASR
ncbi:hypothetical protein PUR34_41505 [Streptomyces sp. JV185]|uniref:hypothetical protein n=1 Tax=Streptomyces sp. JV185 TaxID=858638 RepID=UPI002E79EBF4|nr:hypothetical protein [Streptomyces sp. JV185]MEE1774482.1 hypothetical protein [Streptomyces sp. JV185]